MPPRLLLLGHFPPPRGGVAAHLDRLRDALRAAGINVQCLSFGGDDPAHPETLIIRTHRLQFCAAMLRGAPLLHYHSDERDWKSLMLLGWWCALRGQRFMVTLHSFRDHDFLHRRWSRRFVASALLRAVRAVCISENLRDELARLLPEAHARIAVIPSFLPPSSAERNSAPPAAFAALARDHKRIICFNAFAPTMYDGKDLYGADVVLEAFAELAREDNDVALFMVFVRFDESPLAQQLRAAARALGDRVMLVENYDGPFVPILLRSAVTVRATMNDGGPSISVLEALSLGVWCAASDAVPRPASCALFKNRDAQDLARALRELLARYDRGERQRAESFPTGADGLLPLYDALTMRAAT